MADAFTTGGDDTGASQGAVETPTHFEIADTSYIKAPGLDKPVQYKDFISGYVPKSDLTRMRQQDARERADWQAQKQREETQLRQTAQQLAQRLSPQQGSQADPLAAIASAPYIEGKVMAQFIQATRSELARRDEAMGLLQRELQTLKQGYGSIQGRNQQTELAGLFDGTHKALKLPDNPEVRALIESEYWAHEGWDKLSPEDRSSELSRIVKQRYDGLQGVFRTTQQQRVDESRRLPPPQKPGLKLNGRGAPTGMESAEDLATRLYPMIRPHPES